MIQIKYKPAFVRQYKKLPEALRQEAKEKIDLFSVDPNHSFLKTHKLKSRLKDRYSFFVNYQYRIVFEYETKNTIVLLAVGDHDVYK